MAQNTKGWVLCLTVLLLAPTHLKAQSTSGTADSGSGASISAPIPTKSKITGSILVQTASTVNTADYRSSSGLYMGTLGYNFPKQKGSLTASLSTGYQTQYTYQGEPTQTDAAGKMPEGQSGDLVDPRISLMRTKPEEGPFDSISYGVKATLAGMSQASEYASQVFSIGPSAGFTENLGSLWKPLSKVTLSQTLNYRYIHHNYKTQNNGKVNSPHSMTVGSNFDYALGSRSGIVLGLSYAYRLSYQNVQKTAFGAGLEAYYTLTDEWSLSLGVSNDTTGFAADGQTRELDLMKPQNASAYLNINVKI
jgi:hypothetical protein